MKIISNKKHKAILELFELCKKVNNDSIDLHNLLEIVMERNEFLERKIEYVEKQKDDEIDLSISLLAKAMENNSELKYNAKNNSDLILSLFSQCVKLKDSEDVLAQEMALNIREQYG